MFWKRSVRAEQILLPHAFPTPDPSKVNANKKFGQRLLRHSHVISNLGYFLAVQSNVKLHSSKIFLAWKMMFGIALSMYEL